LVYHNQWRLQTKKDHQFEHAKPDIGTDYSVIGHYNVTSYCHNRWWSDEKEDKEVPYWTAIEEGAKLKSREAIYKYFNESFSGVKEATCQEINEHALQFVN
jgi:hypothetical protein